MLRALPWHLLFAICCGAVCGALLYPLQAIAASGVTQMIVLVVMLAFYVNAAMLPVFLPGRHWSLAFISALMLMLLLVGGYVLSERLAICPGAVQKYCFGFVNRAFYLWILTGLCLGLFYGLLSGRRNAMLVGAALGGASGYCLGIATPEFIQPAVSVSVAIGREIVDWRFDSLLHFIWQGALAMFLLHLGAGLGATMGAGKSAAG